MKKMMVFARESSKSDKIDAKDRISELPEPIKRHILFFMCPEDAARTTVLSKTWQQTWNSLRRLSFESVGLDCTKTLEILHTEKELTLENVVQDGNAIQELPNRCPMLEAFSIDKCLNVYCLKLFILPNLKMAKINRVRMFSINEAPNLHTLCCRVKISILFLPRTTFNNLRKLSIRIGYNGFDVMYLPRLNSMFPLLETLDLNDIKRLDEVKISHDRLESLSLSSKFNTITDYPLDTWWFLRLKQYLETFKQPGVLLNLQLQIESSMVEFNPALLSEQSICPLTNFKHLRLLHIESSQNHRDIIDGMLWTIHPEMISVKLLSQPDSTFIKDYFCT
uniref:At1g61320/AtMIF1 LRR domain-containing protein n=1 Tax=Quercus lobata TaxID=97700 RepID=A0A7N2KVM2_QUELO